jgi:hypothetical protein
MSKKIISKVCIFSFLLLISVCQASSVSRTFSKTSASPSENINVNLTVSITSSQDTYYAIDESYPSGWTIVSTAGDTNQSGHVKFVVSQAAVNTNQTYVIRASATPGTYTFSGVYMFNTTYPNDLQVSDQTQVAVRSKADVDNSGCVDIADMSAVALDFGKTFSPPLPASDITQNGVVDIFDLVYVGKDFGVGC